MLASVLTTIERPTCARVYLRGKGPGSRPRQEVVSRFSSLLFYLNLKFVFLIFFTHSHSHKHTRTHSFIFSLWVTNGQVDHRNH